MQFRAHVLDYSGLQPLLAQALETAVVTPLLVDPSLLETLVKALYALDNRYLALNQDLFRRFIPPRPGDSSAERLDEYAFEAQHYLQELAVFCGFQPDLPRKRVAENSIQAKSNKK